MAQARQCPLVLCPGTRTTGIGHQKTRQDGLLRGYSTLPPRSTTGIVRPGGRVPASGKAGAVKAATAPSVSEGSLDRRSPPGRYAFPKPGRFWV